MTHKILIVGMGFGQLYNQVHSELGHLVVTVDNSRPADFTNTLDAIRVHGHFKMAHICTPNFTHESIARDIANHCDIILIEKPGVKDSTAWSNLIRDFPKTRIMMTKNNQYRDNISDMIMMASLSKDICLTWNNNDRVPNPGTWFTTKELSYGGVSRDLLPHLLSLFQVLSGYQYKNSVVSQIKSTQFWKLQDLTETDYGTVNLNGTYNVEDKIELGLVTSDNRKWNIESDWRTLNGDERDVLFIYDGSFTIHLEELGLCPESAYRRMIITSLEYESSDAYWNTQYEMDMWIHKILEKFD